MEISKLTILISSLVVLTGCDYFDDRLIIHNNHSFNIYVAFSEDTIMDIKEDNTFMMPDYFVESNHKKNIIEIGSKKAWEFLADKSLNKQLHIFILSEDKLKKHKTSEVIKGKLYEERIDIGIGELEAENWEIVTPH